MAYRRRKYIRRTGSYRRRSTFRSRNKWRLRKMMRRRNAKPELKYIESPVTGWATVDNTEAALEQVSPASIGSATARGARTGSYVKFMRYTLELKIQIDPAATSTSTWNYVRIILMSPKVDFTPFTSYILSPQFNGKNSSVPTQMATVMWDHTYPLSNGIGSALSGGGIGTGTPGCYVFKKYFRFPRTVRFLDNDNNINDSRDTIQLFIHNDCNSLQDAGADIEYTYRWKLSYIDP